MKLLATLAFVAVTGAMTLPGVAKAQEFYRRPRVVYSSAYPCAPYTYNYRPGYVAPVYRERVYSNYVPARPYVERGWRDGDRRAWDRDRGRWDRR
jgi:hypothetical protein